MLAVGVLEITIMFNRDSDIPIFLETFCSMEVELNWMGLSNGAVEGQLLFKESGISKAWRSGEKTLDM